METFGEKLRQQIEAHLIDFDGDLYNRTIRVELLDWAREQRKYEGLEPLLDQIRKDIEWTKKRATLEAQTEIAKG